MGNYRIGTGRADITYLPSNGKKIGLLGFGLSNQKSNEVDRVVVPAKDGTYKTVSSKLYSRSFIIVDQLNSMAVILVVVDIWSCTRKLKSMVTQTLSEDPELATYTDRNVMICGTHTHSAPGGYAQSRLYDVNVGGNSNQKKECAKKIRDGIVDSIRMAHRNLSEGRIHVNLGKLFDCGVNRSPEPYNKNVDRDDYEDGETDKIMHLLRFSKQGPDGTRYAVGSVNWFPVHPTNRDQRNRLISGDSKGYAALLLEHGMEKTSLGAQPYVGGFANSNCGDVSVRSRYRRTSQSIRKAQMVEFGTKQYKKASALAQLENEEVIGKISCAYADEVNMSEVKINGSEEKRTWLPTLGLSMFAGSKEDGSVFLKLKEGIVEGTLTRRERYIRKVIEADTTGGKAKWEVIGLALLGVMGPLGWAGPIYGLRKNKLKTRSVRTLSSAEVDGHRPKPITVVASPHLGKEIVPIKLPLQILRIGQIVILGIPGELTTMAGRRLRETMLNKMSDSGVKHVLLTCYANEYSQYITTKEEYNMQHYEGASTLFGPYTLQAYQQEFSRLANELV